MKTESKHTPGPWEVRGSWVFPKDQDDDICHMSESYLRSGKVRFANADLIAAAPSLLNALRFARCELDMLIPDSASKQMRARWVLIDKAIAKAEGME